MQNAIKGNKNYGLEVEVDNTLANTSVARFSLTKMIKYDWDSLT